MLGKGEALSSNPSPTKKKRTVNSTGVVCDQKISIFFVSHREESMAGHLGIN
jgi:hypothetical protein